MSDFNESSGWSAAPQWPIHKFLKHSIMEDDFDTGARFGLLSPVEDLSIDDQTRSVLRYKNICRMTHTILMIIMNNIYQVKDVTDRQKIIEHKELLRKTQMELKGLLKETRDHVTKKSNISINEELFEDTLRMLEDINESVLYIFAKHGLSTMLSNEFDPDKFRKQIQEDIEG
jgi:hypothetical protein